MRMPSSTTSSGWRWSTLMSTAGRWGTTGCTSTRSPRPSSLSTEMRPRPLMGRLGAAGPGAAALRQPAAASLESARPSTARGT
eukprot:15476512-Alexandrium_andersonii.AAC.1